MQQKADNAVYWGAKGREFENKARVDWARVQKVKLFTLLVLTISLYGCSSRLFDSRTDQQIVEDRATERWRLLAKRDFSAAYQYLSPGSRETIPENIYIGRFGTATQWLGTEPVMSECQDDLCKVTMRVRYRIQHKFFPKGIENSREFKEKWIRSNGQWWYLLEK